MSIASDTVPMFRTEWADRLSDVCTIFHPVVGNDRGTINSVTLQYPNSEVAVVTGVSCLVRPSGSGEDAAKSS